LQKRVIHHSDSLEGLKTKMVILKTKLATAMAEEKDNRGGEEGNRELREETILLFHPT
jgi:hypothetical protein